MANKFIVLLCAAFLLIGTFGCSLQTDGEGIWELCLGVHTKQISDKPAKVELKSSVIDKIVDSLTDGKVSEEE